MGRLLHGQSGCCPGVEQSRVKQPLPALALRPGHGNVPGEFRTTRPPRGGAGISDFYHRLLSGPLHAVALLARKSAVFWLRSLFVSIRVLSGIFILIFDVVGLNVGKAFEGNKKRTFFVVAEVTSERS